MSLSAVNNILRQRTGFQITVLIVWGVIGYYLLGPVIGEYRFVTLQKILKNGQITVVTRNTADCYYLYRDQPMGFEYELAQAFAADLGVRLEVKVVDRWDDMFRAVNHGSGAFIAASVPIMPHLQQTVAFSDGYMEVAQQIIAHRKNAHIKSIADLSGKTIDVREGTAYQQRLAELKEQGIDLAIRLHADLPTEELIQKVADGEINFTIAQSNIISINRRNFPGAVSTGSINDRLQLGWAVYPKSIELRDRINTFFKTIKESGLYDKIYQKYYGDSKDFDYVDLKAFHHRLKTRLSRYSPFIKVAANKHGFDWRLIAAQIYQESHLNPWAKSRAGARGLMQILPSTARGLGVTDLFDPVQNINAGVKHLKILYDMYDQVEGNDRLLIALAAYNTGQGHIYDARKLARKKGLDPNKWESLAQILPLLQYRKYYKHTKYGYCRGSEPVRYIKQILIYYDVLKRQGFEYKTADA
ncbi:MAG: membrane-bound lytic murein transglycosylase MltF [Deltaproteobacteria bacterium]|nr:membrane-bound lytic murein transglycosylase MltF [Deltaproteobacteria bacterium]